MLWLAVDSDYPNNASFYRRQPQLDECGVFCAIDDDGQNYMTCVCRSRLKDLFGFSGRKGRAIKVRVTIERVEE